MQYPSLQKMVLQYETLKVRLERFLITELPRLWCEDEAFVALFDASLDVRVHRRLFSFKAQDAADHGYDYRCDSAIERVAESALAGVVWRDVDAN